MLQRSRFLLVATLAALMLTIPVQRALAEDGYVLSLSWSPEFCTEGRHGNDAECRLPHGFIVHGLWPAGRDEPAQGCDNTERVSEATIQRLLPIMASRSLIIHEWRKHGRCSGLSADCYLARVEQAWRGLQVPAGYAAPNGSFRTSPSALRRDFRAANTTLPATAMRLSCSRDGALQEVRICLNERLAPAACAGTVRDRCSDSIRVPAPQS